MDNFGRIILASARKFMSKVLNRKFLVKYQYNKNAENENFKLKIYSTQEHNDGRVVKILSFWVQWRVTFKKSGVLALENVGWSRYITINNLKCSSTTIDAQLGVAQEKKVLVFTHCIENASKSHRTSRYMFQWDFAISFHVNMIRLMNYCI